MLINRHNVMFVMFDLREEKQMLKLKLFSIAAVAMLAFTACGSNAAKDASSAAASSAVESAAKDASSAAETMKDGVSSAAESTADAASSALESATSAK